jgi:hypothetical protein
MLYVPAWQGQALGDFMAPPMAIWRPFCSASRTDRFPQARECHLYAVFCRYKNLPVIDGGLLVQNRDPFVELARLPLQSIGRVFENGQAAEL